MCFLLLGALCWRPAQPFKVIVHIEKAEISDGKSGVGKQTPREVILNLAVYLIP